MLVASQKFRTRSQHVEALQLREIVFIETDGVDQFACDRVSLANKLSSLQEPKHLFVLDHMV